MRNNQPVTQHEYPYPNGEALVTTTDLDSRITYVNSSFQQISGFEESELLGQYHNVIRHPDMPAEAFRDMWETLRSGLTWRGAVKNRRKDGDHYWVKANVTPLYRKGQVTGYLSVRTEATRAEIDAAEALYRRMREESGRQRLTLNLYRGDVVRSAKLARLRARWQESGALASALYPIGAVGLTLLLLSERVSNAIGTVGTALALLALVGVQTWRLHERTVRPMHTIRQLASRLAGGDLDVRLEERDKHHHRTLLQAMEQLVVNLRGVVGDVRNAAGEVSHGSSDIAASMNDIAERSMSQSSSLQQTSSAMDGMTQTIASNAASAQEVGALAKDVEGAAEASDSAMTNVVATMNEIHQASQRIEDILEVINTLSFQTNLLALNASVEAARAGEQGKGFSVVASEVRNLAHQSAESANQIRELVNASSRAVTEGLQDVQQAHGQVATLKSSIREVSLAINQISDASGNQASGVLQISTTVSALDSSNRGTSKRVETSLERTQRLERESQRLIRAVGLFSD